MREKALIVADSRLDSRLMALPPLIVSCSLPSHGGTELELNAFFSEGIAAWRRNEFKNFACFCD
jgi:hypothetical protein